MFTRVLGISPREYQAQLRTSEVRRSLSQPGASVTGAIYQAGYGSSSRFYERAAEDLGMSPTRFRERGLNETIRFATTPCELGLLLVAATERGLCSVMLGDEPKALEKLLREQFSSATIVPDESGMKDQAASDSCRDDGSSRCAGYSAGCARHCIPGPCVAGFAANSTRRDTQLC